MKRFKGTKKFNSYKEVCAFLGIEPAPKGVQRQKQLSALKKYYDIEQHKGGRYSLTYLTQKEQKRREDNAAGKIKVIDGHEINIMAPSCYKQIGIDDVILYHALNCKAKTWAEFYGQCFAGCSYFQHILSSSQDKEKNFEAFCNQLGLNKEYIDRHTLMTLSITDELIRSDLKDKVKYCLSTFKKNGFIIIEEFYQLSDKTSAPAEEILPYIQQAYKNLGIKNLGFYLKSSKNRKKYIDERNRLYEAKHPGVRILQKTIEITPQLSPSDTAYPCMTKEEQDSILSKFFVIFREKLIYRITKNTNRIGFPLTQAQYGKNLYAPTATRIVETYCVFEPNAKDYTQLIDYDFYAVCNFVDECNSRIHESKHEKIPENQRDF